MQISIITIFPEYFDSPLRLGVTGRAIERGLVDVEAIDLRTWGRGVHRQVDDSPFGGGPGMVLMPEPLAEALDTVAGAHRVLLTPGGAPLSQDHLDRWAQLHHLALVCGRYEGVDERIAEHMIDEEVSLGDYVIAGGEAAALVVIEGVVRLIPDVVGNAESIERESFREGTIEEPHYTRPAVFRGWEVPEVLRSGDHGRIEEWRREQREQRTAARRPDLG
ncbi:MAG: tRNA (guanosine(37)-N1)-methyltransferase TrmD [Acidimicrobiia bacterium]|nr:tRNA (guanosine(37)-N1)-methyltransferase TrmD [Acidimicrobiia bacterium]